MPYPELRGESRGVPQVAAGSFVFSLDVTLSPENLSCCLREVRPPFKLSWPSGLLSRSRRGIGPHPLLRQESRCFSPVAAGISGFLLSFNRGVRPRLVFRHGIPLSSQVVKGLSGLLSS